MSLKERILKNSTIRETRALDESEFFEKKTFVPTKIPMVNVALSGRIDGGLESGFTMLAGESKHFKSGFALLLASTYLNHFPDAIVLFYDSEFGTPLSYIDSFGINKSRVIHSPLLNVEQLKHDLMTQLEGTKKHPGISREDKVLILIDSIGNLASKKEVEDALEGKTVADMTRAKALKSLFRMVTPHLRLKDIPLVAVNHIYKTMEMYAKNIVGGGTGSYYAADNIWIIGRQQEKDKDNELVGYNFIINVEKSRYVVEKAKIPISVSYSEGINRWSGLQELALEGGYIHREGLSWVSKFFEGKYKTAEFELKANDLWPEILAKSDFADFIRKKYSLTESSLVNE